MAFLLWLSAKIDRVSYPETLQCLLRMRHVTLAPTPIDRPMPQHTSESRGGFERRIALSGDSLSTAFYVSSLLQMLVRARRGWKTNWFLTLPADQAGQSVVMRLSAFGTITGVHHASVAAMVDVNKRRSALNHLMSTYHFCHQVDEILLGPFPDMLLIWIGHNDVDWRSRTNSLTPKSVTELSKVFVHAYEVQLRRLMVAAVARGDTSAIIVFGLADFESFFLTRAETEAMKETERSVFPHLETGYKSFVVIWLAILPP
ncbi:hypothetical protein I6F35_37420 [Bradyrhizobium sp. BRP22]|uniref:hypothetical protein n=1 Tax=Bradyrhizobium sp. BRP22 TaxID=2793821 RepID=UPI001CD50F32|nr:hypothetical protein [Bradyrhizobium sp. BRP22]MCA1458781.1 hypothetical protein [Bradyrhizobium sp. BRP22]